MQNRIRDLSSFREIQQEDRKQKNERREFLAQRMAREAVEADALTHHPEWDLFLSYVQGLIVQTENAKLSIDTQLCDAPIFDDLKLRELKFQSMLAGERLFTLKEILHIPKVILEEGQKGLEYLSTMKGKGTAAEAGGKTS